MSEGNENKSFATASSGKSPEEVAFELVNKLKGQGVWGERNISAILDMYAECLDATKGLRQYEGQNRVEVPIKGGQRAASVTAPKSAAAQSAPKPAASVQAAPAQATPAARPQAAPVQARPAVQPAATQQPVAAQPAPVQPTPQPVHAQQQALQNAYKQA